MPRDKVILAYSGGLDTSVMGPWIGEKYNLDVVAFTVDLGQGEDLERIRQKALQARAVAHGCTGKGNDQVRFDVTFQTLAPDLKIIAPVREWKMSRDEEIQYAARHGIPVEATRESPYSVDLNLWGRSCEAGVLEDPWEEPPADAFAWTADPAKAPNEPAYVTIDFERGKP